MENQEELQKEILTWAARAGQEHPQNGGRVWSRRAIPFCWQRWRQKKGWKRLTLYISTSRQR
ncbi:hypothetical protein ACI293_001057 [Escherichia coli]